VFLLISSSNWEGNDASTLLLVATAYTIDVNTGLNQVYAFLGNHKFGMIVLLSFY